MAAGGTPALNRPMITASIMTATVMIVLDSTIANVALPHMQGSLNASQDQVTWILTSYIVAQAILTPLTGWLAGRLGRKNLFIFAVAGFTISSALCGLATSIEQMVVFRLLQGAFGAPMLPLSQAVLLDINPKEKHGQAMAIYGMGVMIGPIMGPVVGGWLTESYSWRWCFYINVPIGLAAIAGIFTFIHGGKHENPAKLDLMGFLMLSLGVGALQLMLDRGEGQDWFNSSEIWIEAAIAALGMFWFAIHTITAEHSFVDRRLLRDRNFITASILGFCLGVMLFSTMALLPPLMQRLMGYPVLHTGLLLAPRGFGTLFAMFIVGRLIGRIDVRLILLTGFLLCTLALWQLTQLSPDMGPKLFIVSGILQGIGMGMIFVPLSTVAFGTLAPALRTDGSGIYTLVRNLGSGIGISVINASQLNNIEAARSSLVDNIRPDNPVLQSMTGPLDVHTPLGLALLDNMVTRQAGLIAYIDAFFMTAILCAGCIPLLLLLRTPKQAAAAAARQDTHHVAID